MSSPRHGFLLITDISGYTCYLSRSELEHAQGVLTALLELLIEHTRPPLAISRLEGDAVISYALEGSPLHGQTFVEAIETTYVAFRKAIERMVINNSCQCNACANVVSLDLKFFLHYGTFALQSLGGHEELVGSDVNLIHRLLKNRVTEATGIKAYTLYTDAALEKLELDEFRRTLTPHSEEYEFLGRVQVWIQDLAPVWIRGRSAAVVGLPPEQVLGKIWIDIALPREVVWDYVARPEYFRSVLGADRLEPRERSEGRIASGSGYQCFHGDKMIAVTILEWQPFERLLMQSLIPIPVPETYAMFDMVLESIPSGTRLTQVTSRARGPFLGRVMSDLSMRFFMARDGNRDLERFKTRIEEEVRQRGDVLSSTTTLSGTELNEAIAASLTAGAEA